MIRLAQYSFAAMAIIGVVWLLLATIWSYPLIAACAALVVLAIGLAKAGFWP
jgi:hypothetical protein